MGELEPVLHETFMAIGSDIHIPVTSGKTTLYSSTSKNNGKLSDKKGNTHFRQEGCLYDIFPGAGEDRFWILFLSDLGSSAYFSQLKCHVCKICDDRSSAL